MSLIEKYYAHGKLLITGEYSVLDGAKALAIPTKLGQSLEVHSLEHSNSISWTSYDLDQNIWFEASFSADVNINKTNDNAIAITLGGILKKAIELNPNFLSKLQNANVTTRLEFDQNWGLGSSSTLIDLIAQWAEVDSYALLKDSFGGSGYDLACARATGPILFELINSNPKVQSVEFTPPNVNDCYFIYLGQKQTSKNEIAKYSQLTFDRALLKSKITEITNQITNTVSNTEFCSLLETHESELAKILNYPVVKQLHFQNVEGTFKSLGAWGGDFVLFTGPTKSLDLIKSLGYTTIISWNDMLVT